MSYNTFIKSVKWLEHSILLEEHVSLNEPRQPCFEVVADEFSCWHSKNIVKLFECALLTGESVQFLPAGFDKPTLVSGTHKKIQTNAIMFNAAKKPNAPVEPKASRIFGNVKPKTPAQKRHVATAHPIPTSLCESGKTSAEYVNGTGPSPGE